jgi:squalene cyclase
MMTNSLDLNALEGIHKELLEKDIIDNIAQLKSIDMREAMDIYYRSKLSKQVDQGEYGIQYLDAKNLADDLIEHEPELFAR